MNETELDQDLKALFAPMQQVEDGSCSLVSAVEARIERLQKVQVWRRRLVGGATVLGTLLAGVCMVQLLGHWGVSLEIPSVEAITLNLDADLTLSVPLAASILALAFTGFFALQED